MFKDGSPFSKLIFKGSFIISNTHGGIPTAALACPAGLVLGGLANEFQMNFNSLKREDYGHALSITLLANYVLLTYCTLH